MAVAAPSIGRRGGLTLVGRQVYYEQLAFWRNPFGAVFTVGFSLVFLLLLAASGGASQIGTIHQKGIQYYVPGFAAYGVMSACFNMLGINLVIRRETGLLKRLHLSPIPTWALLGAIFLNSLIISALQVVMLVLVGRFGYHVVLPSNYIALLLALVVGAACFTALGVAISSVIPTQEAAAPIISIIYFVLLFLSGLWFPLAPHSGLAKVSAYFPVRHMILAVFAPFNQQRGASPWAWHDILVLAIWAVVGAIVALRRFRWEAPYKR